MIKRRMHFGQMFFEEDDWRYLAFVLFGGVEHAFWYCDTCNSHFQTVSNIPSRCVRCGAKPGEQLVQVRTPEGMRTTFPFLCENRGGK